MKNIRVSVGFSENQYNAIKQEATERNVSIPVVVLSIVHEWINGSNIKPVGRPKKEPAPVPEEKKPYDIPGFPYHKLSKGMIDDVESADICFLDVKRRVVVAGKFYRNSAGEIVNPDLPASNIDICTEFEAEKLPPSIKEIITKKFTKDPTGGVSGDEMRDKIKQERDAVSFVDPELVDKVLSERPDFPIGDEPGVQGA